MHAGERSRWPRARLGLVLAAGLATASVSAHAAFVFYFRTFGDWSLICALDEPSGRRDCSLSAPPPALAASRSVVAVTEETAGAFAVAVRLLGAFTPGAPVYLRVDANAPHRGDPDRLGEAAWRGAAAERILDELADGERVVLRSFVGSGAEPRDEIVRLAAFAEALELYRAKVRRYGALAEQ